MVDVPWYIIHRICERLPELIPAFPAWITRIGGFVSYVMTYTHHITRNDVSLEICLEYTEGEK